MAPATAPGKQKAALFQAAFCSLSTDDENAAYYKRLREV